MLRTYEKGIAIVTGGASGIGKAVSRELARRGAEVVIADLQEPRGDAVAREITSSGGRATAVPLDVRDRNAVFTFVESVRKKHGRIDYVFNNAGTGVFGEAHLQTSADWDLQILSLIHISEPTR